MGIAKVNDIVAAMKKRFNVDDDRVWLAGFSDGGSGSLGMSMLSADNFAAFMSLSGQMGVTAQWGGKHLYPMNMAMSPQYVVNTDLDKLYLAEKMRKTILMANDIGASILYNEHFGIGHDFSYADAEMPNFKRFLLSNPRKSAPEIIVWKSASNRYGTRFWISINETIDVEPKPWHVDHNMKLSDDRIFFGLLPDWDYKFQGVLVDGLTDGDTYSRRAGMLSQDIIIRANDTLIRTIDDLNAFKDTVKRGEFVKLTVLRDDKPVELSGNLDPVQDTRCATYSLTVKLV